MEKNQELGRFVRWGSPVRIDLERKVMRVIPEANEEQLVEIPNADTPADEVLDLRVSSY